MDQHITFHRLFGWDNPHYVDSSVTLQFQSSFSDWSLVRKWYSGFNRLPLPPHKLHYLKTSFFTGLKISVFIVSYPTIIVYRWPDGQLRRFLLTANNYLLESYRSSYWDHCFPFIHTQGATYSFELTSTVPVTSSPDLVWFPESSNYTHFLFDSFAPLLSLRVSDFARYTLDYYGDLTWQSDFFRTLPLLQLNSTPWPHNACIIVQKPKSLIYPVIHNIPLASHLLRKHIDNFFSQPSLLSMPETPRITFFARTDNRSNRIANLAEISSLVTRYNGQIVDPSCLSIFDKHKILCCSTLCIGESSSLQNAALFALPNCEIIYLVASSGLDEDIYLHSGWPYHQYYAHRTYHVVGDYVASIPGSPLPSCRFKLSIISQYILNHLASFSN